MTKTTDADLVARDVILDNSWIAATLDFSNRNTANNAPTNFLFTTTNIQPGGFDVKAVRVKNDGQLQLQYQAKAVQTSGDDPFCQALEITVIKDWQKSYQGSLSNFSLESTIPQASHDDWIIMVKLNQNSLDLINKSCDFNLIFETKKNNDKENLGFSDEEILENHLSSGSWQN